MGLSLEAADLVFLAAVLLLLHLARRWIVLFALLVWPGTAMHELSHWLVAMLLGGRPALPHLVPQRNEAGRWRLGSVSLRRLGWWNALPIALAPLLLAPFAAAALQWATRSPSHAPAHWIGLYVAATAAVSCLPSAADWRLVLARPAGLLFYGALLAAALASWRGGLLLPV